MTPPPDARARESLWAARKVTQGCEHGPDKRIYNKGRHEFASRDLACHECIATALTTAARAMREAAAKVVEDTLIPEACQDDECGHMCAELCYAAAIRALGEETP